MGLIKDVAQITGRTGRVISTWTDFEFSDSFTDPVGNYRFRVSCHPRDAAILDDELQRGGLTTVFLYGQPQASAVIETIERDVDENGITFTYTCNGVLIGPYKGSVDPYIGKRFNTESPITEVVLAAMELFGFDMVVAKQSDNINKMTGQPIDGRTDKLKDVKKLKQKDMKPNGSETAYQMASRFFNRQGVALRCAVDGTLMLCVPNYDQPAVATLLISGTRRLAGANRMLSCKIKESNSDLYSEIVVRGTGRTGEQDKFSSSPIARVGVKGFPRPDGAPYSEVPLTEIEDNLSRYKSPGGTIWRPLFVEDQNCTTKKQCENMAIALHGAKCRNGFVVKCEVGEAKSNTGYVWCSDLVVRVVVDELQFDQEMWILDRQVRVNDENEVIAELTLLPKGALVLGEVAA